MFALRKITNDGLEMNFSLGDSYTLVIKERSPKEFEDKMKDHPFMIKLMLLFIEKMRYYRYIKIKKTILFLKMGQLIVT